MYIFLEPVAYVFIQISFVIYLQVLKILGEFVQYSVCTMNNLYCCSSCGGFSKLEFCFRRDSKLPVVIGLFRLTGFLWHILATICIGCLIQLDSWKWKAFIQIFGIFSQNICKICNMQMHNVWRIQSIIIIMLLHFLKEISAHKRVYLLICCVCQRYYFAVRNRSVFPTCIVWLLICCLCQRNDCSA